MAFHSRCANKPTIGIPYAHNQLVAANVWTINHSLGFWPSVTVFAVSGQQIEADITNPTVNQTVVTLAAATAGSARLQ